MAGLDPLAHVRRSLYIVSIDYPAIIAAMTGTSAADWSEVDGPESGVGAEYHFEYSSGALSYAHLDQDEVVIRVMAPDGSDGAALAFELPPPNDA